METTPKNTSTEASAELWELASRSCNDALRPEDLARLESLLAEDQQARHFYGFYMLMHAELAWRFRADEQTAIEGRGMAGLPAIDGEAGFGVRDSGFGIQSSGSLSVGAAVELPSGQWPRTPNPEPPFPTLSTTNYPPPATPFVGSWAFSCMVSAVIMGVMLLVFWAIKVTPRQHIAEAPSKSVPSDARPEMVFVGRITGMVDVKWSDDPRYLPPPDFAHVPLDRKYILSSGLLEITYDSGAKVILEGPCTYEVESTAGGYLSLGKLTARVEKRGGKGSRFKVQGSRSKAEPSSFILHPSSLFSVRTPTAIVTDLGTEFGVEVSDEGNTTSHVFRGLVKVQVVGDSLPSPSGRGAGGEGFVVQLSAGESARVEKGEGDGGPRLVLLEGVDNPPKFVRRLREPTKVLGSLGTVDGSIFRDDFDGDAVDADKWVVAASSGGALSVADGAMTLHTPADEGIAYLTGAAPLDFSGSPDDWWVEVRFKMGESLTTNSWKLRHWTVLGGMTVPPATWEMRGFDLRVMQQGAENSPIFILGWWGWDNGDNERSPEWLVSNLKKGRFYIVKIHRKPDGNVDIYLDDRLIAVRPLIASQNPGVLKCGDISTYMNGTQIVDYVKVGALVPTSPDSGKKPAGGSLRP